MANEIRIVQIMSLVKDNFSYFWHPGQNNPGESLYFNLVGDPNADIGLLSVTTSITDFSLVNVETAGLVSLRNTDDTNYVDIGYNDSDTFRDLIRLNAGDVCSFRLIPGKILCAKTNTGTVIVQFMIFEN